MSEYVSTYIAPQTLTSSTTTSPLPTQPLPATIVQPLNITALQNLLRPLTVNGQVLSFNLAGELSLQTNLGKIDLQLSSVKSDLFKTLNSFITAQAKGSQKPFLELSIQPGSPSKEAMVLVPLKSKGEMPKPIGKTEVPFHQQKSDAPLFVKGQTLSLTPVPKGVDEKSFLQKTTTPQQTNFSQTTPKNEQTGIQKTIAQTVTTVKEKSASLLKTIDPRTEARQEVQAPRLGKVQVTGQDKVVAQNQIPDKVRIDQLIQPKQDWPAGIKPEQVKAEVAGRSLSNQTIIKSEGKSFIVTTNGTLPQATKIVATPVGPFQTAFSPLHAPADQNMITGIQDIIGALQATSPKAAQSFVNNNIPSPQQNMGGTLIFLLSAIQGNKVEEWIGSSRLAHLTAATRRRITDPLAQSFQERGIAVMDDSAGDWRSWSIPLMNENVLDALRFYVRDDKRNQKDSDKSRTQYTRFVISMNMSQLGQMQLDGLSQTGKLDLIVRSEKELPTELLTSLKQSSHKIYEATGLKGSIQFQENADNWINFKNEQEIGVSI